MRTGRLQPKSAGRSGNVMSFTAHSQYTKNNAESIEKNNGVKLTKQFHHL